MNFELGTIDALQQVFPETTLTGCFFHLGQSIYRSIHKNGLVSLQNQRVCCLVLHFLPPNDIYDAFNVISNKIQNEVKSLLKYFVKTYVLGKSIIVRGKGTPRRNQMRHPPRFASSVRSVHHPQA